MKNKTPEKIIDIATFLFATQGFDKITLRQLATTGNINIASFSYYFGGKEQLYDYILKNQFSPAIKKLQEIEALDGLTATERLKHYVQAIAEMKGRYPYLTSFWHHEMLRTPVDRNSAVKQNTAKLYHSIFKCLSQGISAQEFKPTLKQHHLTILLLDIIHSPFADFPLDIEPSVRADDKVYFSQAFYLFMQGIKSVV